MRGERGKSATFQWCNGQANKKKCVNFDPNSSKLFTQPEQSSMYCGYMKIKPHALITLSTCISVQRLTAGGNEFTVEAMSEKRIWQITEELL